MKFAKKFLENRTRVILAPMDFVKNFTLLVLCAAGSKNETKKLNGISHFLEHLFFKGTKSRPEASDINKALDGIGASYNAFTSREITGYWVKAASRHFDFVLEIISDILLNPLFKPEEIEKERGVILQEIAMYNDTPMRKILDYWPQLLYADTPAGRLISGTIQSVKSIKGKDILAYKENHYVGSNLIVIAAGNLPSHVYEKTKNRFAGVRPARSKAKEKILEKQSSPGVKFHYQKTDQTHLVLGARAYNLYDKRKYALELANIILGGNTSSRIYTEIRERLGLAYYVRSETNLEADVGSFYSRAGISHDKLGLVVQKIVEIFREAKQKGIAEEELSRAKEYIRGQLALSLESSDELAVFYGEQEIFKEKILTPEEILKRFLKVKLSDIRLVLNDIFKPQKMNLVVIGPHKNEAAYKKILAGV